jgi:LysR family transcriptional regulator, transcriptional activator of nhaA
MSWLNYHHLYYFKHVVDEGSIVKASEVLRVGQPSISMQIKLLEEQLQKKLFIRKNKRLVPTEEGKIVYDYAYQIFNLGKEMMTTLNDRGDDHIKIQIGVQGSVPKNLISKVTSYVYTHFDAEISVLDGSLEETTSGVINHRLDVALLNHRPLINNKAVLYSKKILESKVVLAGSPSFAHLKNKPIQNFSSAPLILPTSNSPLRQSIEYFFNSHNMKIRMVGEANDTVVQKNMAIYGNGIIAIMEDAIDVHIKNKQLIILKEMEGITDEIWLISRKRDVANPIANKLIKEFRI